MVYRCFVDEDEVLVFVTTAHAVKSRAVGYSCDAVVRGKDAYEVAAKHEARIFVEIGGIERAALIEESLGGWLRLCIGDCNRLHLLFGGFELLIEGYIAGEGGSHVFAAVAKIGEYECVFAFFESQGVISNAIGRRAERLTFHTDGSSDERLVGLLVADVAVDGYGAGVVVVGGGLQ